MNRVLVGLTNFVEDSSRVATGHVFAGRPAFPQWKTERSRFGITVRLGKSHSHKTSGSSLTVGSSVFSNHHSLLSLECIKILRYVVFAIYREILMASASKETGTLHQARAEVLPSNL